MERKEILLKSLETLLKYFYQKVRAKMFLALTHDIEEIGKNHVERVQV
jgi:hypothetical protein